MSTGSMYVIHDDGRMESMTPQPYETEELLQVLLAQHPDLITEAIDAGEDRRWALVARELPVPDSEGGAGRWSLDHLLLDHDGVATLVEVKRSSDTRIRREVVGQMLDYAANGIRYWPVDDLRRQLDQTAQEAGSDGDTVVHRLLGDDVAEADEYWRRVEANLRVGRIRMVFVADRIPPELRRVVEFLNEQMHSADVLAVELEHFHGTDGSRSIVPRLIGATTAAQQTKGTLPRADFTALLDAATPATKELDRLLADLASTHGLTERTTHRARQWRDHAGGNALALYMDRGELELDLTGLRAAGLDEDADHLVGVLTSLTGKKLTRAYPLIPAVPLVTHWAEARDLLTSYLEARRSSDMDGAAVATESV